jgi:hypothetical protein
MHYPRCGGADTGPADPGPSPILAASLAMTDRALALPRPVLAIE